MRYGLHLCLLFGGLLLALWLLLRRYPIWAKRWFRVGLFAFVVLLGIVFALIPREIRTQEYGYRACVKGLVYTLLMEIVKITSMESLEIKSVQNPNWDKLKKIELAMQYVDTHYAEEIRISDIANAAYISESYLRRIFAETYNMSPLWYVNFVRIDSACKILRDQALNINEVAQKVGFDNTSTFIKNFKKIVGKTPKQWRKEVYLNNHTTDAYKNGAQKWWG